MRQKISVPVSVELFSDHRKQLILPRQVIWGNRNYPVSQVGLRHSYRQGQVLFHVFSVISGALFFRLVLDTESLFWRLEEIADNESG